MGTTQVIYPKVSIIILAFDDERYSDAQYLPEAIASAKNQTYPNVEVIVMDGGGSKVIECPEADAVIRRTPNRGVCNTLELGVQICAGDWVVPLNADDKLGPDFVRTMMDAIEINRNTVIAILSEHPLSDAIFRDNYVKYCCLANKDFWVGVLGGFQPPIKTKANTTCDLADWDLWIRLWRLYRNHPTAIINVPNHSEIFIYRDRPDSASKWKGNEFEVMRAELWRQHGFDPNVV